VLVDVCKALDLQNASHVASRLDEDELTTFNVGSRSGKSNVINESGLYSVILRSDKPEAKAFKRWITHEVLPTIRKTGGYGQIDTDILHEMKELDELNPRVEEKKKALCKYLIDGAELSHGLRKALYEYLQMNIGFRSNVPLAFPPVKEEV
jgi:prophage antirepressor-like protein